MRSPSAPPAFRMSQLQGKILNSISLDRRAMQAMPNAIFRNGYIAKDLLSWVGSFISFSTIRAKSELKRDNRLIATFTAIAQRTAAGKTALGTNACPHWVGRGSRHPAGGTELEGGDRFYRHSFTDSIQIFHRNA